MKKKVLLMTIIGLVLLSAVIAAALNAVFTVTDVRIDFSVLSEEGETEAAALQKKLEDQFVGKSTTFLDLADVTAAAEEFPAFRVESAVKQFPRTLALKISERREVFAFIRNNDRFAILDEDGVYLYDKDENVNRCGGANLLLEGFRLTADSVGSVARGAYFEQALKIVSVFSETLDETRVNLASIALIPTENHAQGDYFFCLRMAEGVIVNVYTPDNYTAEKAEEILKTYLSLDDEQKMYGLFDVIDDALDGWFRVSKHRDVTPADE